MENRLRLDGKSEIRRKCPRQQAGKGVETFDFINANITSLVLGIRINRILLMGIY